MADGSPGQPEGLLGRLAPGSRVAGYQLEDRIGAGGMAVVFRARDERLDRLVALKMLTPALAADEGPDHVYLSDFGLSKGLLSSVSLTGPGHFLGTPDYSAPEQISGKPTDGRTDQYALACVAFTLLTGEVPFRRDEPVAVLYAHLSAPPPSVTVLRPDLPRAADEVLARALAKAPENRFGGCGAFAGALRDVLGLSPYDSPVADSPVAGRGRTPTVRAAVVPAGHQRTQTAPPSVIVPDEMTVSAVPSALAVPAADATPPAPARRPHVRRIALAGAGPGSCWRWRPSSWPRW